MVVCRVEASGFVKVSSGLIPLDLKRGNSPSLESRLGSSCDSHARSVLDLLQQRIGLREITRLHRRANLGKPVTAGIATEAGDCLLQFLDLDQRVSVGRLDIRKLALDLR